MSVLDGSPGGVIEFDNLVRTTDVIGQLTPLRAKSPEPFANSNAPGMPHEFGSLAEIQGVAYDSGVSLRKAFAS